MNNTITMYTEEIEDLTSIIAKLSTSGDNDFVAVYEEKLKNAELRLIEEVAKTQLSTDEDVTLIMYRTTNYGIITPQIARRIFNKEIL